MADTTKPVQQDPNTQQPVQQESTEKAVVVKPPEETVPVQSVSVPVEPVIPQQSVPVVLQKGSQTDQATIPATPMGGLHKEQAPLHAPTSEYLQPSDTEVVIPSEVKEAGVEVVADRTTLVITGEQKTAGIQPAKESTPVMTVPSGIVTLPLTAEEVVTIRKNKKVSDSIFWFATLVLKQLREAHQKLLAK